MHTPMSAAEADSHARTSTGYVLVILGPGENEDAYRVYDSAHREFIEDLIRQNQILLGGAFATAVGDVDAAYVLRTGTVEAAQAIADADPFVVNGVCRRECREWKLVGINPDAVDDALIVRPEDIA
jgi:uncharacterized protein YciI